MIADNQTEQALADVAEVRLRVRSLEVALRCFAAGIVTVFGLLNYLEVSQISRYGEVFQSLMGSLDQLSVITQFILGNHLFLNALTAAGTIAGLVFAFRLPGRHSAVGIGICLVILVVTWLAVKINLADPFYEIVTGMTR